MDEAAQLQLVPDGISLPGSTLIYKIRVYLVRSMNSVGKSLDTVMVSPHAAPRRGCLPLYLIAFLKASVGSDT